MEYIQILTCVTFPFYNENIYLANIVKHYIA